MKSSSYLFGLVLLVAGSLALSAFLVPGQRELALMHYKAKEFERARGAFLELRARGDQSTPVVKALSELHLQFGEIDQAIEALEDFVDAHPSDVVARERLGTYYQYAQRPNDYRFNLEIINQLALSEESFRELSAIYNAAGEYEKQIRLLQVMVAMYPDRASDFLDLAYLQAQKGMFREALATLDRLDAHHPNAAVHSEVLELKLNLLLDDYRFREAFENVAPLLIRNDPNQVVRLAGLFEYRGAKALALKLLEPFDRPPMTEELLSALVRLEMANGRGQQAFERLRSLYLRDQLPERTLAAFVELALSRGDGHLALNAIRDQSFVGLPNWLLCWLAETAHRLNRPEIVTAMLSRLGWGFLDGEPVLAAELAYWLDDPSRLEQALARLKAHVDEPEVALPFAFILERTERRAEALAILKGLASARHLPESSVAGLASLFMALDQVADGYDFFDEMVRKEATPARLQARAFLAAGARRDDVTSEWLRLTPRIDQRTLLDLYYVAGDAGAWDLAAEAAERLLLEYDNRADTLLLARALLEADRPVESLERLRELTPTRETIPVYREALRAAYDQGAPVRTEYLDFIMKRLAETPVLSVGRETLIDDLVHMGAFREAYGELVELIRGDRPRWRSLYVRAARHVVSPDELVPFLDAELARRDTDPDTRAELLWAWLELGADERALPHLRRAADELGGDWVFAFEELATRCGQTDALREFWLVRADRNDLPETGRRAAAYRLLDLNETRSATRVFFELASEAGADSPDVSELVYLWGDSPPAGAVSFLERRALDSRGLERWRWLNHLSAVGAHRRVVEIAELRLPRPGEEADVFIDTYHNALLMLQEDEKLARQLEARLHDERDPRRLRNMGRLAVDAAAYDVADAIYRRLLEISPERPDDVKQLGLIAFSRSDYVEAKKRLARYLSSESRDHEALYYYGEILLRDGAVDDARRYFARSLERIEQGGLEDFAARNIEAQLLHRLGRDGPAFRIFQELLDEAPGHTHLRADFVAALMDRGRHEAAERLLREGKSSSEGRDRGGQMRLDLLWSALYLMTERPAEALAHLETMESNHPDHPLVIGRIAGIEESAGRWRRALKRYDHALSIDPRNVDLRAARNRLAGREAPRVGVNLERVRVEDTEEQTRLTVGGYGFVDGGTRLGFEFTENVVSLDSDPHAPGHRFRRHKGELFLRHDGEGGSWIRGGVWFDGGRLGLGVAAARPDLSGQTDVSMDLQRPYWDFGTAIVRGVYLDRFVFRRTHGLSRRWSVGVEPSIRRYTPRSGSAQASMVLDANLTCQLKFGSPSLAVQYLLDTERLHETPSSPFINREVHAGAAVFNGEVRPGWWIEGDIGYSWDRLGGRGGFWDLALRRDLGVGWAARAWWERRLFTVDTSQTVERLGFLFFRRF